MTSSTGQILYDLRTSAGKSMTDVARDLNISLASMSRYESGERNPRDDLKSRIASYYGVSVQDIFYAEKVHGT